MIDFLLDYGIDKDILDILNKKYSTELFDLSCNKKEIVKIIKYLRDIGVTNIEELLIYETWLFYKTFDFVKEGITKFDVNELVTRINDNYEEIGIILS